MEIPNDFGETPGLLAARSSKGEAAPETGILCPFVLSWRGENTPSIGNASPKCFPSFWLLTGPALAKLVA